MFKNINRKLANHNLASSKTAQPRRLLSLVAQHQGVPLVPHGTVAALHFTVRHGAAPLWMALHRNELNCAALYYIALHCTALYRYGTVLHHNPQYGTVKHRTVGHDRPMYSFNLTHLSSFWLYFRFMPSSQSAWLVL